MQAWGPGKAPHHLHPGTASTAPAAPARAAGPEPSATKAPIRRAGLELSTRRPKRWLALIRRVPRHSMSSSTGIVCGAVRCVRACVTRHKAFNTLDFVRASAAPGGGSTRALVLRLGIGIGIGIGIVKRQTRQKAIARSRPRRPLPSPRSSLSLLLLLLLLLLGTAAAAAHRHLRLHPRDVAGNMLVLGDARASKRLPSDAVYC